MLPSVTAYVCVPIILWLLHCLYVVVTPCLSTCACLRECICLCMCVFECVCGTVEQAHITLCPCYIWVTTLSLSLQPLSFSPLSAPIAASVHSTRLMVCVIHSDSFTTSHLFVLLGCVCVCGMCEWEQGNEKENGRQGELRLGKHRGWTVCVHVQEIVLLLSFKPLSDLVHHSAPPSSSWSKALILTLSSLGLCFRIKMI